MSINNCRLCQTNAGSINVDVELSTKIINCTNIHILNNEDTVVNICVSCKRIIEEFDVFLKLVHRVNEDFIAAELSERSNKYSLQDTDLVLNCDAAHSETVDSRHQCKICKLKFEFDSDLSLHEKEHGEYPFVCSWENCKKVCRSAYMLKTHQVHHTGKRPFLCVTCGKGFVTKNSLNCHEKIHADVKAFNCEICNIGFSVRSNLRAHERKHHEGVRFYCSQCTRAFISKCSLDRHERLHTGVKEFQCDHCTSAFYTSKELLKHQRYHQGLKKHKCDQCYKTFFEKHHLTIHLRSHSGERPYVCKIPGCNKSFTESQKLTRHLKARHPPPLDAHGLIAIK